MAKEQESVARRRPNSFQAEQSRERKHYDEAAVKRRAYRFSDLAQYSFRDRFVIRAMDLLLFALINLICLTVRWEVRGTEHLTAIHESGHRAIFTFWHACIFSAAWLWRKRGIVVMSSKSRDAEYTSRVIRRFGYGAARGSSTRGAGRALAEMAESLACGIDAAFTIDGPRGPAYVAKTGAVTLARHTGQAILPFHISSKRRLELRTWDRQQIPALFTKAIALIGEPIYVPREASEDEIRSTQEALQITLDRLRCEAEDWRRSR